MKTSRFIFIALLASVLLAACGGGTFKKAKSGLMYKIISDGKGQQLVAGDFIKFNAVVKYKDSVTYNSYGSIPAFTRVDSAGRPYDISEVLNKLRVGDSAVFVQLADTLAKMNMGQLPGGLKKGDKITIMLKVVSVYKNMELAQAEFNKEMELYKEKEQKVVEAYLKSKNINATKTTLGTYVEIINPGTAPKADSGKEVSVKYTGMNFDGKKFDSNVDTSFKHTEPYKFVIGQMGSIPGFEDGVKQLGKGGKAKVYIPSMLGYGAQGSPPAIKPFENLLFEIEVLDITAAPKAPVAPPIQQSPAAADTSGKK